MRKVIFSKVKRAEIEVLKNEIGQYPLSLSNDDLENLLITAEVSKALFVLLRTKLESDRTAHSFQLKLTDSIILMRSCSWNGNDRGPYEQNVCLKFLNIIDQQLKSIFITHKPILENGKEGIQIHHPE